MVPSEVRGCLREAIRSVRLRIPSEQARPGAPGLRQSCIPLIAERDDGHPARVMREAESHEKRIIDSQAALALIVFPNSVGVFDLEVSVRIS